jgi:hypothetical protein
MASIAASPADQIRSRQERQGLALLVHSPAVAAALLSGVLALVVAVAGPMVARKWQNHERALEVRTTLATDMSQSFTMAVGAAQRVASGLIYGPTGDREQNAAVVQAAYNAGLGRWQIDGGRITAELSARFADEDIVHEWSLYRLAVTRFYRLSAVLPEYDRQYLIGYVRSYFQHVNEADGWAASAISGEVDWDVLQQTKGFSRSLEYRRTYDQLSSTFLALGDAFVAEVLKLNPKV